MQSELYDIGTEILYETCFVHNSTQKVSLEELQVRIVTKLHIQVFYVKTRFPFLFSKNVHATLDSKVHDFIVLYNFMFLHDFI